MSLFSPTNSDYVQSPAAITAAPFTVGCWVSAANFATAGFWTIFDDPSGTNWFQLYCPAGNFHFAATTSGLGGEVAAVGGGATANMWFFVVCRANSPTNRRIDMISADGSTTHGQNTTSNVPAASTFYLGSGAGNALGSVAEFWYTDTDIQADGLQLDDNLLRQLAYGGPFSVPHIEKDIIEYRSLRSAITSAKDRSDEVYSGHLGRQAWTATNAPIIAPHCPLPYWYENPLDREIALTV
jgi:hypothetical protein